MFGSGVDDNPLLSESARVWDDLIEAVGPPSLMLVIASRMSPSLKRGMAPEDIWQEVLLHAWRDRHQCEWRGLRSFRSWLLSIIDHRIQRVAELQATLKRGGHVRVIPEASLRREGSTDGRFDWAGPAGSVTPGRAAIYREQAAAMQAALQALPEEFRDVVRLRLFDQLTMEAVAEQLGLTPGAARYRFARGAERYRQLLRSHLTSGIRTSLTESTALPSRNPSPESSRRGKRRA